MSRLNKILAYLSGRTYAIDADWGFKYLNDILINSELIGESNLPEYFTKQKQESLFVKDNAQISAEGNIAIIDYSGMMTREDGMCSYGIKSVSKVFTELYANDKVKGILFRINTGGGESDAGSLLMNTLQDRNKPVVVYSSYLASAGIKGTLTADEIIAESNSSQFGSIGSMFSLPKKYLEMYKEYVEDVYSEKSPEKNSAFRKALEGDFSEFRELATKSDELFMADVRKHRKLNRLPKSLVNETLRGGMFTANDAKRRGLIDSIGTLNHAMKRLQRNISK